jgi:hypothetical protein
MTTPPTKPDPDGFADDDVPFRAPTEEEWAELDAWEERNKDALNASIRRAREEYARGEFVTHEEVLRLLEADRLARARKA